MECLNDAHFSQMIDDLNVISEVFEGYGYISFSELLPDVVVDDVQPAEWSMAAPLLDDNVAL